MTNSYFTSSEDPLARLARQKAGLCSLLEIPLLHAAYSLEAPSAEDEKDAIRVNYKALGRRRDHVKDGFSHMPPRDM